MASPLRNILDPDLVILNGQVVTVDDRFSLAEAVVVKAGRILAVGDSRDISELVGEDTQVIDLEGRTLLPGIIDHHVHGFDWTAYIPPLALDLSSLVLRSFRELLNRLEVESESKPVGEGIFAFGLDPAAFIDLKERKNPFSKKDLDSAVPKHPVCIQEKTRDVLWANSKALKLAKITKYSSDPPGCRIERDAYGEPTGFIETEKFSELITIGRLLPPLTMKQRKEGILKSIEQLNSLGITSILEPGHGVGLEGFLRGTHDSINITILNDLKNAGQLNIRVSILLLSQDFLTPGAANLNKLKEYLGYVATNKGFGDEWVRIGGLKMIADYLHYNQTAWMWDEYADGGNGSLSAAGEDDKIRLQELKNMIRYAHHRRWPVGIHAIGDRAIDAVVESFAQALKEDPWDARHYVIHANFVRSETAGRMGKYHIGASIQTVKKWRYRYAELEEEAVGPERNAYNIPMRTLLDAGVRVANGSDFPENDPDWRRGVEAAVTRISDRTGKVSGSDQRVTRQEALRSYTIDAAYLDHQDKIKGSIEPGKLADFCILGDDLLTVEPERIHEIPVLMTIVGGRVVYDGHSKEIKNSEGASSHFNDRKEPHGN